MTRHELASYFHPSLFVSSLEASTKDEVFGEVVEHVKQANLVKDAAIILEMLNQREKLGSTGIGHGVAIPHGRSLAVPGVVITFAKSEQGIDFAAIDKKPVYLVFIILAPPLEEDNKYLVILGKLVELLSVRSFRQKLMKVDSFDELIGVIEGE